MIHWSRAGQVQEYLIHWSRSEQVQEYLIHWSRIEQVQEYLIHWNRRNWNQEVFFWLTCPGHWAAGWEYDIWSWSGWVSLDPV